MELLEEATAVRPDFAEGLNRLALAYGRLGLDNQAVATIRKAMELEPNQASHPATLVTFGDVNSDHARLALIGLAISLTLLVWKIPTAIFWGMILTALIAIQSAPLLGRGPTTLKS